MRFENKLVKKRQDELGIEQLSKNTKDAQRETRTYIVVTKEMFIFDIFNKNFVIARRLLPAHHTQPRTCTKTVKNYFYKAEINN